MEFIFDEKPADSPFTTDEFHVHTLLMEANDIFVKKLQREHPNELPDWINAIHMQQMLLGMRVLRRTFPEHYYNYNTDNKPPQKVTCSESAEKHNASIVAFGSCQYCSGVKFIK